MAIEWDTTGLEREACDSFTTYSSRAEDGRKILDEVARINECLRRMAKLTEVRVASSNDCSWSVDISTQEVKVFVTRVLEDRKEELKGKFNRLFAKRK